MICRIDDRLIHGQVVTAWVKQTEGNRIVIIDEALVKDVFLQKIIKAAAPSDIRIDIYNIENGVCELKKEAEDKERIIILVKTPQVVEALIDEGILLDKVILGGMGAKSGRRKFNRNVSASEEEIECMQRIMNKHIPMYYQLVPNESPSDVGKMISG